MSDLKEFCCICVKKYPHLENINEADEENIKYQYKLSICVPCQIWKEDYNICKNCIERLDAAYNFIQICTKSEELRIEQLKILQEEDENKKLLPVAELFGCDICKKQFKLKRSLKLHVTRIHYKKKVKLELVKLEEPEVSHFEEGSGVKQETDKLENQNESNIENSDKHSDNDDNFDADNTSNFSSDEDVQPQQEMKKRYNKRKNPLTCEYCGKVFNRRQHWSSHIRSKHTFEKPYQCNLCDAKYTNSHSLLIHKRNHNNEKPFICSYCGKSFVCSGDLYHHSKIHLNKREYKCSFCDKSFNTASILRTHKICIHTDPKDWKYVCTFCSRRFPINSSLATHLKRHTGVKGYSCYICDKKFFDNSELTKHIKSHSSDRLHKCNICEDKEYKNRYGLRKHMKIVHDIGSMKITKPVKKFLCPLCPKIFAFNNKLQKHMCTHTGEKPFKCDYCDKRFVDNYYRKVHLKKKHNMEENVNFL